VTLCVRCHGWVHANIRAAREAGWLIHAGSRPDEVPIQHHAWPASPIWLRDDGTVSLFAD